MLSGLASVGLLARRGTSGDRG
ncbi:MAG: hypothetical protein ACK4VP_02835 [Nitrospira sp.]